MFDWFFAEETSRVILTTLLGSAAVIFSAFIASRNVSKTIENQNKGLPPELLRLEKMQEIIISHNTNSESFKDIHISNLKNEYQKAVHRSVLESQIGSLGVQDEFSRKKLLSIPDEIKNIHSFPDLNTIHGSNMDRVSRGIGFALGFIAVILFALSILALFSVLAYLLPLVIDGNSDAWFKILPILLVIAPIWILILFLAYFARLIIFRQDSLASIETDLIVRNIYQHYSEYFTGYNLTVVENESELKKRIAFENSKKFRKWIEINPGKSSWDYGFNSKEPLNRQKIEGARPVGYSVGDQKYKLIREFPFLRKNGRKIVKSQQVSTQDSPQQSETQTSESPKTSAHSLPEVSVED